MGGLSPIRSFNLEGPSKLENRSVKPRRIFRVRKLTKHQATIPSSMTSQKIQLREGVIIANRKDIMLNLVHGRINHYTMEVARVKSIQDYHQQVIVTHNTKEAHDEIDVVDDMSLPCKRCYLDVPVIMPFLRIRSLCPLCNKNYSIAS